MASQLAQPNVENLLSQSDSEELKRIRHTCAHILAMAVQRLFPDAKVALGPATDTGFYYDFDRADPFTPEDLGAIEAAMRQIIQANLPIISETVDRNEIRAEIEQLNEPYKLEILEGIPTGEGVTRYFVGSPDVGRTQHPDAEPSLIDPLLIAPGEFWWDLCAGPHMRATGELHADAFALESVAGAYWRGDEANAQLQRIYGTAWERPAQLQAYLHQKEEAKRRDHRKLGQTLKLFSIQEDAGGGLVFWHPKGARIRRVIEDYWRQAHTETGYELLFTPHLANLELMEKMQHAIAQKSTF